MQSNTFKDIQEKIFVYKNLLKDKVNLRVVIYLYKTNMIYSIELRTSKYFKKLCFVFSFARKFGVKYSKKRLNTTTKNRTDAVKTATKGVAKNFLI